METLPFDIEQKLNNLPVVSFDNPTELQNILISQDYTDLYTYYEQHYLPDEIKTKSELYKRLALYLAVTNQDAALIDQIDTLMYRRPVPTIEEFLSGKFYMYDSNATLYPYWREKLEYMFREGSPVRKTIFGGSVGVGKSTIARKAFIYVLYRILCLRDARAAFNVDKDATIANIIISMTLKQVYDTNLMPFIKLMETMPCFQRVMRMQSFQNFDLNDPHTPIPYWTEKSSGTIYFPDNIIITCGSGITHTIGYNIVNSFCFTEAMKVYTNNGIVTFSSLLRQFNNGIKFYTYCIDKDGNKEKTEITDVKITGYKKELIRIYYDDIRYIECTPEHPFVILNPKTNDMHIIHENGISYKEAQYLTEEDEILSENNAFVYALIDNIPTSKNYNKPFYIGISSHDNSLAKILSTKYQRPYTHFTQKSLKTTKNIIKNNIIKKILKEKLKPDIRILYENLTLEQAFEKEKYLIKKYGKIIDNSGILANISDGGEGIILTTPEMINRKSRKIKETKAKIRLEKQKLKTIEYTRLFSDYHFVIAFMLILLERKEKEHQNRVLAANKLTRIKQASKHMTQYNKSEKHRKETAYYNSIKPKVSSKESREKLSKSQSAAWNAKSEEEKTKDNISKSLGRAWNVLKRIKGNIINEYIFNSHRSKGSRLANTEPVWKTIITKVGGIDTFLKLIEERFERKFIYEN